ncbi:hypothetical protein [Methanococcoides sp. NM1]|uniref:hypothetical protein n=1 Tax=Methanococcoides sp. NM1 TaxID=1201013 RepID=UPI001082E5FA|nr:hypothetical protein [Methanococcoides sp. NM1]
MKTHEKVRMSAMFMALLVVSLAFVPAASAKAEITWQEQMLESNGISVNDFNVKMTSYEKVGDEIHYNGDFKIDVEKKVDDKLKMLKTKGTFSGIIKPDGSTHIEYIGNNFDLRVDSSKIGENQENILYQFDQVMTVDGKTKKTNEIREVPKEQIVNIDEEMGTYISGEQSVSLLSSSKIDVPSTAPWGSTLIYDDVQYADILATGAILTGILAYFGLAQAAALSAIAVAVGYAIAEYAEVDTHDIYLDFFLTLNPLSPMHVEVDYFYV